MKRKTIPLILAPRRRSREPEPEARLDTYILQGKQAVRCLDYQLWEDWIDYDSSRCLVDRKEFYRCGTVVETKFLGFDVAPAPSLGPLLFEVLVEGGDLHGYQALYATWDAAKTGHDEACQMVRDTFT